MPANRLAREKSPYLLQHAHNPVDWFAWNDEAFGKARTDNKPIFLSIGYSTCHWCHVMERESFEDETTAAFLNHHFVSIKVDREERPDVDKIYMTFVQSTTGSGGWPMSVFLTPERKPFFGGTYFPPEPRHGRPSFLQILQQISQLWQARENEIITSAAEIHGRLATALTDATTTGFRPGEAVLKNATQIFKASFDMDNGGFGGAPKFPQPSIPSFLLRAGKRFHDDAAVEMVLRTCDEMAAGGIHDQLGGGFARYAVDAEWRVPHFEKMLYDNAQLAHLYLDAFLAGGAVRHAAVVRGILDYVLRDLTHPDGGFFSAEDADSEGHEGKFYCWTQAELSRLLTVEEFKVTAEYFGITAAGNFVDHSHPHPLGGQNVLSCAKAGVLAADLRRLESAKQKMREARDKRIRPHRDDKVLASWNGLMLGAFARAAAVLADEKYRTAAEKNAAFLRGKLWDEKARTLFHRWRDGERDRVQLLEAYAFLLSGVIDLYEATLASRHLDFAVELAEAMIAKFYDAENGGFWQSTAEAADLILRMKDDYDGAEPSGNSVAALALLKLGAITGREPFTNAAEKTLRFFAARLRQFPQALPLMLHAVDFQLEAPRRVVIAGAAGSAKAVELRQAAHAVYQPNKIVLGIEGPVEEFAKTLTAKNGATAFICTDNACLPPTCDAEELKKRLE